MQYFKFQVKYGARFLLVCLELSTVIGSCGLFFRFLDGWVVLLLVGWGRFSKLFFAPVEFKTVSLLLCAAAVFFLEG